MADMLGIDRRYNKDSDNYKTLKNGCIPGIEKKPIRLQMMLGDFRNSDGGKSNFNKVRWQFMLFAPFNVSNACCRVMKKELSHRMHKQGMYPITAQMASESKLRTQKWMQNGCNAFDVAYPISNPMSFWTEQDVLTYIKLNNLEIAPVYGDVIYDGDDDQLDGQMSIYDYADLEEFDLKKPLLKCTGCSRTGCFACGYGSHLKRDNNRFSIIDRVEDSKLRDVVMRGGEWSEDGNWIPGRGGLGYWFVLKWLNVHGGFTIEIPEYERYEKEYGDERTRLELEV